MKTKTALPKELNRVVKEIRRVATDQRKLQTACMRHREIFAVHPHIIDLLPHTAQALLLSDQEQCENENTISVTTPDELQRFYRR